MKAEAMRTGATKRTKLTKLTKLAKLAKRPICAHPKGSRAAKLQPKEANLMAPAV